MAKQDQLEGILKATKHLSAPKAVKSGKGADLRDIYQPVEVAEIHEGNSGSRLISVAGKTDQGLVSTGTLDNEGGIFCSTPRPLEKIASYRRICGYVAPESSEEQ